MTDAIGDLEWWCQDCHYAESGGGFRETLENLDNHGGPARALEWAEGWAERAGQYASLSWVGMGQRHGLEGCGIDHEEQAAVLEARGFPTAIEDLENECDTDIFGIYPCPRCGSSLAGSRHAYTLEV